RTPQCNNCFFESRIASQENSLRSQKNVRQFRKNRGDEGPTSHGPEPSVNLHPHHPYNTFTEVGQSAPYSDHPEDSERYKTRKSVKIHGISGCSSMVERKLPKL